MCSTSSKDCCAPPIEDSVRVRKRALATCLCSCSEVPYVNLGTSKAKSQLLLESMVDMTGSTGIRMMPFGVGRRICAGLNIAVLHLLYLVANMVREFEWKEAAGHEVDLAEKLEFMVVMKKELRPRLVPRKPNMQTEEHL